MTGAGTVGDGDEYLSPCSSLLQITAENEPISSSLLSTHSAVEMLHDSALYKSIIDTDIASCQIIA